MRTKIPASKNVHGAHGAPYTENTLNLLALGSDSTDLNLIKTRLLHSASFN